MICEHCSDTHYDRSAVVCKLLGGFTACLCTDCINAWHDYVTAHPLWIEYGELEELREREAAEFQKTKELPANFTDLRAKVRANDAALYALGKSWVKTPTPAPAQSTDAPQSADAVDPIAAKPGKRFTRAKNESSDD